tara:strand:+ start:199 stop:645 length:447 start_codon:yes stop_codon:yes gene_type:complete
LIKKYIFNLKQLESFAKQLAKEVKISDLILLSGDLGSGKTTFARFLIKYITLKYGEQEPVYIPSPTFPILQNYPLVNFEILHYDLYRINDTKEIIELSIDENLKNNISIIEWPEILLEYVSKYSFISIDFSILDDDRRKIIFKRNRNE